VALVVIKFAEALRRTGQADLAAAQYQLAARIARANGLGELEALALEHVRLP
jgi:hypothetical protein